MFLFLIGPGCFYLAVLIFYEFLFWLFNGSAKHFVFFELSSKLKIKSFFS